MSCPQASQLSITALDIFDASPASWLCSVPGDLLRQIHLPATLGNVRTLSISIVDTLSEPLPVYDDLGNPDRSGPPRDLTSLPAVLLREEDFAGLSRFLNACPQLEILHISYYHIPHQDRRINGPRIPVPRTRHMQQLAALVHLPRLQVLYLGGLRVHSADLIEFLSAHRDTLQTLKLRCMKLADGEAFSEVIDCLRQFSSLETIQFDNITEAGRPVLFAGRREQPCTAISGVYCAQGEYVGRDVIRRRGDDVRKPLQTFHRTGFLRKSLELFAAHRLRRLEFGTH